MINEFYHQPGQSKEFERGIEAGRTIWAGQDSISHPAAIGLACGALSYMTSALVELAGKEFTLRLLANFQLALHPLDTREL